LCRLLLLFSSFSTWLCVRIFYHYHYTFALFYSCLLGILVHLYSFSFNFIHFWLDNDVKRTSKRRRIFKFLTKMVLNYLNFSTLSQFFIVKKLNSQKERTLYTNTESAEKNSTPFATQFQPLLPCLKNTLMQKWHLTRNQSLLREIYKDPPLISYRKGKSLKDMFVKAKL